MRSAKKRWLAHLLMIVPPLALLCMGRLAAETSESVGSSYSSLNGIAPKADQAIQESLTHETHAAKTRSGIDPKDPPGIFGIPGAPRPNLLLAFLWAIWIGWIFSTVGAFGGIMAGVGHITLFGFGPYAAAFGAGHMLDTLLTDSIRVSNQWLVGFSASVSSYNYFRLGRLVYPVAISVAVGSVSGAYLASKLTAGQVSLKDYIGYFGLIVLVLGGFLLYQTANQSRSGKRSENKTTGKAMPDRGVKILQGKSAPMLASLVLVLLGALLGNLFGDSFPGAPYVAYGFILAGLLALLVLPPKIIRFEYQGVEYAFRTAVPAIGGLLISGLASFLGVGGGFLLVPFLIALANLPIVLVAGISTMAVAISMAVSIFTYMVGEGVIVPWTLVGVELLGVWVGSMVGPRTQKYIPEAWLKRIFVVLAIYVGLRYSLKGFFNYSILPPY